MSHFTVMIIGNDIEKALAPYNENMEIEPIKEIMSHEDIQRMAKYYKLITENETLLWDRYNELLPLMEDWDGKPGYIDDDKNLYTYSTYNPNSKWDWYQIGGRWEGMLKNKIGKQVDQCHKENIDIESMRTEAGNKAAEQYNKVELLFLDNKIPTIITWKQFINKVENKEITIEEAREQYNNQEAVKLFKTTNNNFYDSLDDFQMPYSEYVVQAQNKAIMTFAIVYNGKWYERGEMGWWACVSNEKDDKVWEKEFNKLFDSIPDNELITIVDCHI
jgi:hypothetical protein